MMVLMRRAARGALTALLLLGFVCAAIAQEVRTFHGRVNWVQGSTMVITPDSGGGAFEVDISKVDQTAYQFLKSGDAVTVIGTVTPDGNKVIATDIKPDQ
jgi:hypothetical protein